MMGMNLKIKLLVCFLLIGSCKTTYTKEKRNVILEEYGTMQVRHNSIREILLRNEIITLDSKCSILVKFLFIKEDYNVIVQSFLMRCNDVGRYDDDSGIIEILNQEIDMDILQIDSTLKSLPPEVVIGANERW